MIHSSRPFSPTDSNALTFTQLVFPPHSQDYLQLDALIRKNDARAVMNYGGQVPQAESRARLYLAHMESHPDAVQV